MKTNKPAVILKPEKIDSIIIETTSNSSIELSGINFDRPGPTAITIITQRIEDLMPLGNSEDVRLVND